MTIQKIIISIILIIIKIIIKIICIIIITKEIIIWTNIMEWIIITIIICQTIWNKDILILQIMIIILIIMLSLWEIQIYQIKKITQKKVQIIIHKMIKEKK